ncbi:MAG: hypothetical protein ACRC5T_02375 [Cetobacterium sp.]
MIHNLTVHKLTLDQKNESAVEVEENKRREILSILNFEHMPTSEILQKRASELAQFAKENKMEKVLIGSGVPAFNYFLVKELKKLEIKIVYSFSKRVCVETHEKNGKVKKEYIFKHEGFYCV